MDTSLCSLAGAPAQQMQSRSQRPRSESKSQCHLVRRLSSGRTRTLPPPDSGLQGKRVLFLRDQGEATARLPDGECMSRDQRGGARPGHAPAASGVGAACGLTILLLRRRTEPLGGFSQNRTDAQPAEERAKQRVGRPGCCWGLPCGLAQHLLNALPPPKFRRGAATMRPAGSHL